jgi:ATP-binding cassette subfamily F protein 2
MYKGAAVRAVQVAEEIWVCDKGTVKPWNADIRKYKAKLAKTMKAFT